MSIINKIQSMTEHLEDAYLSLANVGVDLTNINKNLENLASEIETVYDYLPKITSSADDTKLTLNPTRTGRMEITLKGNSKQYNTATGKNLWHLEENYGLGSGITMTKNADGSYTFNGKATGGIMAFKGECSFSGNHTISYTCNQSSTGCLLRTRIGSISDFGDIQDTKNITSLSDSISSDKTITCVELTIPNNTTLNNFTIYIQLEAGTTATTFEPYSGGYISPSLNWKQDIQTITGNNTIKVLGKNIFNLGLFNGTEKNGLKLTQDTDGGFILNGTASANTQFRVLLDTPITDAMSIYLNTPTNDGNIMISLRDANFSQMSSLRNLNSAEIYSNYTPQSSRPIVCLELGAITKGATYTNYKIYPMIVKGTYNLSNIGAYKTYTEQLFPITLNNIELHKIDTYKDYLYKNNGNWYKHCETGKTVLNGSENWEERSGATSYAYSIANFFDGHNSYGLSDRFKFFRGGASSSQNVECLASASTSTTLNLFTNNSNLNTVANLKTYLNTNNVAVYYNLSTPLDIQITDVNLINQLDNLLKAMSCEETTNLVQVNNNLGFNMSATALTTLSN